MTRRRLRTCPDCGTRWTLSLNPGAKPMPWHDDPRCADCRTAAADEPAAPRDVLESLSALLAPAKPAPDVVAEEIDQAWAQHEATEPVSLICPRCNQPHQRRTPAGHPVPEAGSAVVCGACRGGLRSATVAARPEDGLPVGDMPGPWIADGLCAQTDPELFHPEKGGSTREAKAVCARCPVIEQCRDWAVSTQQQFGIWGGTTRRERRNLAGEPADEAAAS